MKPAVSGATPFTGMVVAAESKIFKVGQATTNILTSLSGGKVLSLMGISGNGSRLKIM